MRCENCPLLTFSEPDWENGEYDYLCAITMNEIPIEDYCTRTNKYIKSLNKKGLLDKWEQIDNESYEAFNQKIDSILEKWKKEGTLEENIARGDSAWIEEGFYL